jgi:hypothetical protein
MEFEDLYRVRICEIKREWKHTRLVAEADRNASHRWPNPVAGFDSLVLRMSKGASERQARRESDTRTPNAA